MLRLYLRLAGVAIVICGLLMAAIRLQPYDDSGLRDVLFTLECAPPCFLGIRPGITTADEAVDLLSAHPWIKQVVNPSGSNQVAWSWSEQAPNFLTPFSPEQGLPYASVRQGIVWFIHIPTQMAYGTARLILGAPTTGDLTRRNPNSRDLDYTHTAGYFDGQITLASEMRCPFSPSAFWRANITVTYSDGSVSAYTMPSYDLIDPFHRRDCDP